MRMAMLQIILEVVNTFNCGIANSFKKLLLELLRETLFLCKKCCQIGHAHRKFFISFLFMDFMVQQLTKQKITKLFRASDIKNRPVTYFGINDFLCLN